MKEHIKYLVQVQCQPSPVGYEEKFIQSLGQSFNVSKCHCHRTGLNLEVRSIHPLADATFKDLADLMVDTLIENNLRLLSGVINRVERNSLSTVASALYKEITGRTLGTREGVFSIFSGVTFRKIISGLMGGTHLVPVMYFHRDVILDLVLAAQAQRIAMEPVARPN